MNTSKISVYGVGNFGFAPVKHLSRKQAIRKEFTLCGYDNNKQLVDRLRTQRLHPLHRKNIRISKSVTFTDNVQELLDNADILVLAVTSDAIREVVTSLKLHVNKDLIILNTAKALEAKTGLRFSTIISDCLKDIKYPFSLAMFAGGTIATDLLKHEPLGVDIASESQETLRILRDTFAMDNLRVYTTTDIEGVEYAAAVRNVVSVFAGVVNGLGFSYGSQTHIVWRAAGEVKKLVVHKLGGQEKTKVNVGGMICG